MPETHNVPASDVLSSQNTDRRNTNPFAILGVAETADDETIKTAYLEKVRAYPPEKHAEQFQRIRAAFEKIKSRRDRLHYRLFGQEPPAIDSLLATAFPEQTYDRPDEQVFKRLLNESASGR